MPPTLALLLWFMLLLALFHFDPARGAGGWSALWVPLIWLFIVASRLPSQWLGGGTASVVAVNALEEGNALDRIILSLLILLAFGILMSRSFDWRAFFAANVTLTALLSFALLSVLWSDFPFVAFKRWFHSLGIYLVILVALSDPRRSAAVRLLIRRLCFVLISLSILLIKYFPEMAKEYNPWTGLAYFKGATTSKNMLGVLCLVSGLFFLWDTLDMLGQSEGTANEIDHRCERRVPSYDALAVEPCRKRNLQSVLCAWLLGPHSGSQQTSQAPSCFTYRSDPGRNKSISVAPVWLWDQYHHSFVCGSRAEPRPHRQNTHLGGRSEHTHQSARRRWLRELLAGPSGHMGLAAS